MTDNNATTRRARKAAPAKNPRESRWATGAEKPSRWNGTFNLGQENQYSLDPDVVADRDYDYEWMTETVLGRPHPEIIVRGEQNGWERVAPNDDPRIAATEIGGQILMKRPKWIGEKWKEHERRSAEGAVTRMRQKAGEGIPVSGGDHPSAKRYNKHKSSFERIEVPDHD